MWFGGQNVSRQLIKSFRSNKRWMFLKFVANAFLCRCYLVLKYLIHIFLRFCYSDDDNHQFYWEIFLARINRDEWLNKNERTNEPIIKIKRICMNAWCYACLGIAAPISIENTAIFYLKCNYGDVFKVHTDKKKCLLRWLEIKFSP